MKSKFIHLVAVCLVAVLSLTLLFQSPASALEGDEGSSGLSREFASGKVKPLIPSDGFKVPDDKIPRFPGDDKVPTGRKPICAGSVCPPSNAEEISRELRKTLGKESLPARSARVSSSTLRDKDPCICEGTAEICACMCDGMCSDGKQFGLPFK